MAPSTPVFASIHREPQRIDADRFLTADTLLTREQAC